MDIVGSAIEIKKIKDYEEINKRIEELKKVTILVQDIRIFNSLKIKKDGSKSF
jgi:hypothetical protein